MTIPTLWLTHLVLTGLLSPHLVIMAGRALSNQVKRQKQRRAINTALQAAVDEYQQEQLKPKKLRSGLRVVASKHGVNYKTLGNLAKGGRSMSAFNASKQRLTPEEERILVDFILNSADRGNPPVTKAIRILANSIIHARNGTIDPAKEVGEDWVHYFLRRHVDELQTHWSRPLDTQRARALNPDVTRHWFEEIVKKRIIDTGTRPQDMYGMDESGFPPSDQGTQRVVGRRGTKTQHKQGTANRENVTVLVTVCADGTMVKPCIIFKGQNIQGGWGNDNIAEAAYGHTLLLWA